MKEWTVSYKHTFGCDVFVCLTKKKAIKKAIKVLKEEFEEIKFPIKGESCGESYTVRCYEDFIEDVWGENFIIAWLKMRKEVFWDWYFDNVRNKENKNPIEKLIHWRITRLEKKKSK